MPIYLTTKSVVKVAYCADVFASVKVAAFKKKIALWANHVHKNRLDMFPNTSNETQQLDTVGKKCTIMEHLRILQVHFIDYFTSET